MYRAGVCAGIVAISLGSCSPLAPVDGISIDGTEFVLRQIGDILRSMDLVGAEIDLGSGETLRIDSVRTDPDDPSITLHRFSTRMGDGDWSDLCEPDADGHQEGFPLPGLWDEHGRFRLDDQHFALTCTSGAQGKCVRFGYKPWSTIADGSTLTPLYEACVRAVRADYCGDGRAATRDGTLIDLFDRHGIMQPETGTDLSFEAGWLPDGAVCVTRTRIAGEPTLVELAARCPRLASVVGQRCTRDEAERMGAVLFNHSR